MDGFSRRYILGMAAAAAILQGRPKAVALPGVNYRDYSRCLPDYLRRLADQARRQRDAALTALTTKAAIKARQTWVRRTFTDLIGHLPARTVLNTTVTGSFERDGYRVDRLFYESRPQYFITANFYRPTKQTAPFPGVLG